MLIPRECHAVAHFPWGGRQSEAARCMKRLCSRRARLQLAGATILRGPMGFGHSSRLHTAKILRLSEDLPIVIEIVDSEEKIEAFLPQLEEMMGSGLITLEKVRVLQYGKSRQ